MAQARTEAKLASTGGGGASGIWGISDATGTYTYYSTFTDAATASSSGDTIELFADVTEIGGITVDLKPFVNINFNGHTYTLDSATTANAISFSTFGTSSEIHFWNGRIIRRNSSASSSDRMVIAPHFSGGTFHFHDFVLQNDNNYIGRFVADIYGGTWITTQSTVNTGVSTVWMSGGEISNATVLSQGFIALRINGARAYNCYGYSRSCYGLSGNLSSDEFHNCTAISEGDVALRLAGGAVAYGCEADSSAQKAIDLAGTACKIYNCTAFTTSQQAIYVGSGSCRIVNCIGHTTSTYGVQTANSSSIILDSTFSSDGGYGGTLASPALNCTFEGRNASNGHAVWALSSSAEIFGCVLKVQDTAAQAIYTHTANTVKYGNNTIAGNPTTPVNALITQGQTTNHDNFGNIVID
jgi:hypothetical protein